MVEEPKEKKTATDLKDMVGEKIKFIDKDKKEHLLPPLRIEELVEMSEFVGDAGDIQGMQAAISVIWMSMRKIGLIEDEIEARVKSGVWDMKPFDVYKHFSQKMFYVIPILAQELIRTSGLLGESPKKVVAEALPNFKGLEEMKLPELPKTPGVKKS